LPSTPPALVDAAVRVLAREHHPDRGGDAARMVSINVAADRIRAQQKRAQAR
jgi:curved DNA-binding protein CbpA